MNVDEIHERLKGRFGEAVGEPIRPEAGDGWLPVASAHLREIALFLRDEADLRFDYLRLLSAVDFADRFAVVYHLYSYEKDHDLVLRVELERERPAVASLAGVWPTADWHEREAFDMMGIVFAGHPELRRILLPEDWAGYPLRKDYQQPEEYHGIPNV